jgi:hypothetical protein
MVTSVFTAFTRVSKSRLTQGRHIAILVLILLGGLPCLSAPPSASNSPEVLVYKDGSRATGRLVHRQDGLIVFDSDDFGRIIVSEEKATVISALQATLNPSCELPPTPTTNHPPSATAQERSTNTWKTTVSIAFEAKREINERDNILTEARLRRSWAADELRFGASYEHTRENHVTTTDMTKGDAYVRHDFVGAGLNLFLLYDPQFELNRSYKILNVPVDYLFLKQPVGLGVTLYNRDKKKVRLGVAENFFDIWFWIADKRYHLASNTESLFLEMELQLPYQIRLTDRGTYYWEMRGNDSGYENLAEISKQLTSSLSLGLRYELREKVPNIDVAHYSLWRLLLGLDF